ncbi:chemotaxis protein CheA [Vibrio aquaticus]|uniref:Chemotaxis protein CheA n=1 Tax=Vibrio aquaticus TaxID=2496559 RepID=A0A432CZJ8_9VIBR|nr:chemotaxis protein CheA [Vibrio aquaticus]RTZ16577.1 chemotaxis protein CheA [Vibrio aquaticus]
MTEFDRAVQVFINESLELTDDVEQLLLNQTLLDEQFSEWIDELFRAIHTIKGSAGLFGFDEITTLTHLLESLLAQMRDGQTRLDDGLLATLIESNDVVRQQVSALSQAQPLPNTESVVARLTPYLIQVITSSTEIHTPEPEKSVDDCSGVWHISLRPEPHVLEDGLDPIRFIHYLGTKGELEHIELVTESLHVSIKEESFQPQKSYLGYEIRFNAFTNKNQILDAFDFLLNDAQVEVLSPESSFDDYVALAERLTGSTDHLMSLWAGMSVITPEQYRNWQSHQCEPDSEPTYRPNIVTSKTLRVEAEKLDRLIDLVGEMVIMGARTNLLAHQTGNEPLIESMAMLERLVEGIRDSSLQLRMVQIGDTFNKFKRIARDTAQELGKHVELIVSGAETELDKTFVEKLSDPLTHLVRNAIDHGLELAADRVAAGKPNSGVIRLNAYHDSGSIVIEVSDDGKGIDEERVLSQAKALGLVHGEEVLTKREIWNLIFEPGFSTSQTVTDLSGRGVGMDVVKKNIELLRGNIEISSEQGKGSRFIIRLPLTLSIVDGFMFKVAGGDYVIPLDNVVECLELSEVLQGAQSTSKRYVHLRDEVLPFLRLAEWFGIQRTVDSEQEALIVIQLGSLRAGLVVDSLSGEFQTVVKPLGPLFEGLQGISGATILGSGEVAIILDIFALIQTALNPSDRVNTERFN